jgi:hypothetical protein
MAYRIEYRALVYACGFHYCFYDMTGVYGKIDSYEVVEITLQ